MDKRRTLFWLVFLGAAATLAVIPEYFERPSEELVEPAARRGRLDELRPVAISPEAASAVPAAPARLPLEALAAARSADPAVDLFASHSWYVPPPPPPPVALAPPPPPPAPSAPPLPFQFLGKLDDSERLRVFLARGERIHTVAEGDVIDGTYRVERITGTQMTLTYLPLNIAQTLPVGRNL